MLTDPPPRRTITQDLRRLILVATLPLAALVLALTTAAILVARSDAEDLVRDQAAVVAHDITKLLDDSERVLKLVAAQPEVAAMDPARCDTGLRHLITGRPDIGNLVTVDRDGWVVCSATQTLAGPRSLSIANTEGFRAIMAGQSFVVSGVRKNQAGTRWIASAAAPVAGPGGRIVGLVFLTFDLVRWQGVHPQGQLPAPIAQSVLDHEGRIVMRARDAEQWVGRDVNQTELMAHLKRGGPSPFVARGLLGFERLWAVQPIPRSRWVAVAGIDLKAVYAPPLRQAAVALVLLLATLATSWALAFRTGRQLAQAVSSLANTAARIASGQREVRASPAGPLELAAVAGQFNQMLDARDRDEATLLNHERNVHELVDNMAGIVALFTPQGTRLEINQTGLEAFGLVRHEVVGKPFDEAAQWKRAPELAAQMREGIERAATGEVVRTDIRALLPDGKAIELAAVFAPIHDSSGAVDKVIVSGFDITERKQAEAALRESEQALSDTSALLERTSEMALVGAAELDLQTQHMRWSLGMCRLHEVDPPLTPSREQRLSFYLPESRAQLEAAVKALLDGGTPFDLELQAVTAKGRPIWLRAQGSIWFENDKPVKLIGVYQDITERKRMDAELHRHRHHLEELVASRTAELATARAGRLRAGTPARQRGVAHRRVGARQGAASQNRTRRGAPELARRRHAHQPSLAQLRRQRGQIHRARQRRAGRQAA